jgi:serine protease Do
MRLRCRLPGLLVVAALGFLPTSFFAQEKDKEKEKEKPKVETKSKTDPKVVPKSDPKTKPISISAPPKVFEKKDPDSISDLKEIETHTETLVKKLTPCVVNLQVGGSEGSGVIISEDGLILTAGHVSGKSDQRVRINLPDGKMVMGKTLGNHSDLDSGMVKITESSGPFPYAELGKSADLKKGEWVLTLGHPNGLKKERPPVVRLSRVLATSQNTVTTGCYLVGGDSGGPLFDMQGRVVGIHSRIGENINENVHVATEVFKNGWDKLASGLNDGISVVPASERGYLGAEVEQREDKLVFIKVDPNSPAAEAGIEEDDVLVRVNGTLVASLLSFRRMMISKKPEEELKIELKRGTKTMNVKVTLGQPPKKKN